MSTSARQGGVAHEQRGRVAEAPLELAGDALGLGHGVALGGVAGHQLAVGPQVQHRGDGGPQLAEAHDLQAAARALSWTAAAV